MRTSTIFSPITCDNLSELQGKRVLLYSGGLDSYLASWFEQPDVCLYVNLHTQYSAKELQHLPDPPIGRLVIVDGPNLRGCELQPSLVVPHRNALLVMMAAYYGSEISLASVANDLSTDKDQEFADDMTRSLRHIWQESYWSPGVQHTVLLPLRHRDKEDWIDLYLDQGGRGDDLLETVSCYDETVVQCGRCKACVKRWTALIQCGMVDKRFASNPVEYFTPDIVQRVRAHTYRGPHEDKRILSALIKANHVQA